jgi:hypothetical protein
VKKTEVPVAFAAAGTFSLDLWQQLPKAAKPFPHCLNRYPFIP